MAAGTGERRTGSQQGCCTVPNKGHLFRTASVSGETIIVSAIERQAYGTLLGTLPGAASFICPVAIQQVLSIHQALLMCWVNSREENKELSLKGGHRNNQDWFASWPLSAKEKIKQARVGGWGGGVVGQGMACRG